MQVLLELGANPNATNVITGATPLHCAIQSSKAASVERRILTVKTLLDAGADPSRDDFFGRFPIDYWEDDEDEDGVIKELLQAETTMPPVICAIRDGNLQELEQVLKHDPSVVKSRYKDCTPLLEVVNLLLEDNTADDNHVHLDMLQLLLENGADPNATPAIMRRNDHLHLQEDPGDGAAALHQICLALKDAYATNTNSAGEATEYIDKLKHAAQLLQQYNATVSLNTQQLLHDAVRRNEMNMTRFLIHDMLVSPNVQGRQGMTPLQFAARSGRTEVVTFLLEQQDIRVDIQDERGQTALDAARLNNKNDIVALLEQHMNNN